MDRFERIAAGLYRAASMSADDLSAEKGEGNPFVQIKRNSEKLDACDRHEFDPQPDWRSAPPPFINRKICCRRCGGEMRTQDAMLYLRGFAHGAGVDYSVMVNAIWPPEKATTL